MPSESRHRQTKRSVTLGMVFITVGCIILFGVLAILAFSPKAAPSPIPEIVDLPALPTVAPTTSVKTIIITPTPDPFSREWEAPIFLPGSPVEPGRLPSIASAADAPTSYSSNAPAQPERLVIPKLGVDAPVSRVRLVPREEDGRKYSQWQVPKSNEVGWHETSAPLGQPGNTVINGHNNIYGAVFRDLIDLEIGEEIILYDSNGSHVYQVTHQELMPENGQPLNLRLDNARWILPTSDERITIVTCWPYTTNSHRLVVIAKPIGNSGS